MTQPNRIASGRRIDRSRPLTFTFNGKRYQGYHGDTLASALLANGVDVVGRSFKYSRPRGIVGSGVEEPNALVQLGTAEASQTPNVRATMQELYDGLTCASTNGWPSVELDLTRTAIALGEALMPPGFYYKTFMFPRRMFEWCEGVIRKAAGLGRVPSEPDADIYDHMNQHCDVLVVGAGPAGLAAALSAAHSGAQVVLADEQAELGGSLLASTDQIDGQPAMEWATSVAEKLAAMDNVIVLPRATVTGYHDHNFLTIAQRLTDHQGERAPHGQVRQRIHRVRANQVVLATGAHERPLVFARNDIPGVMTASAIATYIRRYSVVPGQKLLLSTTNDAGYEAAFAWAESGRKVVGIADSRAEAPADLQSRAAELGIPILTSSAVMEAKGRKRVKGAVIAPLDPAGSHIAGALRNIRCDTIATSGGWSPVVHLACHSGGKPVWDEAAIGFVPGKTLQGQHVAGGINGSYGLSDCLSEGKAAGLAAARESGFILPGAAPDWDVDERTPSPAMALFQVPHSKPASRAPKQFVDLQNDVTAAGIDLAVREGFHSIEHVKRYTVMGFGTDQGKLSNVNGIAIAAQALGKPIGEVGTTVYRPNYTPVPFGAVAGRHCGPLFDPVRRSPIHDWHTAHGALFEDVGQWKRPWYFPRGDESMDEAVARECMAVRENVGVLDASTLGKIDIQGKDARDFLARVYTNAWAKLAVGKCRYGLMCGEDGMVFDDGVTACLGDHHFQMTTTTGGAARVYEWLELYHQTEWPELDVFFTTVTDHWATITITGPDSRKLLSEVCHDVDLADEGFAFMDWREGSVAGVPARIFRISFTGELSYEINVPAHFAQIVWDALFAKGAPYNLTPYGTETMHVLRAEKGFIIVGQDTDGSVHPYDLGLGWAVAMKKPFSFIGKRGMARADCVKEDRKRLVGLLNRSNPAEPIPEGAQAVDDPKQPLPMTMLGHVTSSYYSPVLGHSIAMGFVRGGHSRMGECVFYPLADGRVIEAEICSPVFYDPKGERQNV